MTIVTVDYYGVDAFGPEINKTIQMTFKEYMDNKYDCSKNNMIDIVKKIRNLTVGIKEQILKVSIKKENYNEWVSYEKGCFESAGAYKIDWDDIIGLTASYKGIEVTFKKSQFGLDSEDKIGLINNELAPLYKKVITLCNMPNEDKKFHQKSRNIQQ